MARSFSVMVDPGFSCRFGVDVEAEGLPNKLPMLSFYLIAREKIWVKQSVNCAISRRGTLRSSSQGYWESLNRDMLTAPSNSTRNCQGACVIAA